MRGLNCNERHQNKEEEKQICRHAFTFSGKHEIWSFSRCCFAEDGKEMYQNVNARAERLFWLIKPIVLWRFRCLSSLFRDRAGGGAKDPKFL